MTMQRKSTSIYDYPQHLDPFFEENNHNKLKFWSRQHSRSNSFTFQSIKEFRNSMLPRPRIRTENSSSLSQLNCYGTKTKSDNAQEKNDKFFSTLRKIGRSFSIRKKNSPSSEKKPSQDEVQLRHPPPRPLSRPQTNGNTQQRITVTPLPRIRFHERIKSHESEKSSSSDDNNPFNDNNDNESLSPDSPSKPITPSRKKNKAPPPPIRKSSLKSFSHSDEDDVNQNDSSSKMGDSPDSGISTTDEERTKTSCDDKKTGATTENDDVFEDPQNGNLSSDQNSNLEQTASSSETSVLSETKLEEEQLQETIEDTSDLLELVNKLKMEVDKLTDDTNNNVIAPLEETETDTSQTSAQPPQKLSSSQSTDDNDDVVCRSPTSPRLIRLKRDTEWIKHSN